MVKYTDTGRSRYYRRLLLLHAMCAPQHGISAVEARYPDACPCVRAECKIFYPWWKSVLPTVASVDTSRPIWP